MNRFRLALVSTLILVVGAGCTSVPATSTSQTPQAAQVLTVGTVTGILPYEGFDQDGKTVVGYEPDLLREIASRLGMRAEFQVVEFDALLPGLSTQRFDVAAAGFLDTKEREQTYDATTVTVDRYGFAAKKDVAARLATLDDLCGLRVAVVAGSSQAAALQAQAEKCPRTATLQLRTFDAEAQGFLALKSGQVDAVPSNVPLLTQYAKDNPDFAVSAATFNPGPTAFFFPKGSSLAPKVQTALQQMMDDGTYKTILAKWDVQSVATKKSEFNAQSSGS